MLKNIEMTGEKRFTVGFYFKTLTGILGSPGQFFGAFPEKLGFRQPFGFLLVSGLFFVGASLTYIHERQVVMAGILLVNAVAMPFIAAGTGFIIINMTTGKRMAFERLFAVYAYAAGVTMLASWIPLFVWITEPWKWLLIAIGMVKGCGLRWIQAILISGISIFLLALLFWSLASVISYEPSAVH